MAKREEKREHVLEAARQVLEKYGFRKLTLEDVAREANLATSSLYYYFKNKRELIQAVAELELSLIIQAVESSMAQADSPEAKIAAMGTAVLDHAVRLSKLPGLNRQERWAAFAEVDCCVDEFKNKLRQIIKDPLDEGVASGVFAIDDTAMAAFLIHAGIRGLAEMALDGELPDNMESGMEQMHEFLMNGLRTR